MESVMMVDMNLTRNIWHVYKIYWYIIHACKCMNEHAFNLSVRFSKDSDKIVKL